MLDNAINQLKKDIIEYSIFVDKMIHNSIKGLLEEDRELLDMVINEYEQQANRREVEIENSAISIIARFSPKARELRTILMILKMNNDIERIGDHAVDISESAIYLIERPMLKPFIDIPRMAATAREMLTNAIDCFIQENVELAREVCKKDDVVDAYRDQIMRELITFMIADVGAIERALRILNIARHLERIGDLSTNICEDVIYMIKGITIKHHLDVPSS